MTATAIPQLEVGLPVIVESGEVRARCVIDAVQDRRLVLSSADRMDFPSEYVAGMKLSVMVPAVRGIYETPVTIFERGNQTLMVDIDNESQLSQRRAYVRVEHPIDMSCLLLDEHANQFQPFTAEVTDVGGGGCAMLADVITPQGTVVVCSLAIPDARPVVAIATALANEREDRLRSITGGHKLRIAFTQITEADRDRLIRFLLWTQSAPRR
ncbi:MAG: PilZ domain-containing protein [Acidimicrobiia bacterium]